MSEQTQQALSEAFDLIEADKLDEAQAILEPMLTTHRDNPDVWWLYAHAVTNPETARMALNNVLRLDPNFPDAQQLSEQLDKQLASQRDRVTVAETEPSFLADIPATLPGLPAEDENVFEDVDLGLEEKPEAEPSSRSRLLVLAALGLVAVVVIIAIALITSRPRGPVVSTPTSESIASQPSATALLLLPEITNEATSVLEVPTVVTEAVIAETIETTAESFPTVVPTDTETAPSITLESTASLNATPEAVATQASVVTTVEATSEIAAATQASVITTVEVTSEIEGTVESLATQSLETISQALSAYTLAPNGIDIEETDLGNTLVANVCTDAGAELRSTLPAVMDTLVRQPLVMPVDALGVRLTDCGENTTLRFIVVPFADAQAYTSGSLSEEDFQARWKSL